MAFSGWTSRLWRQDSGRTPTDRSTVDIVRDRNPQRSGKRNELRLTERGTSSPKSVFRFDVQGKVARSTRA
jgi:hypothetical protein